MSVRLAQITISMSNQELVDNPFADTPPVFTQLWFDKPLVLV